LSKQGEYRKISDEFQKVLKQIEQEKDPIKLKILKQKESILAKQINDFANKNSFDNFAKATLKKTEEIQTKLSKLNSSNIDDIAKSITTDTTKLAKVKQIIQEHLNKYKKDYNKYIDSLVDQIIKEIK